MRPNPVLPSLQADPAALATVTLRAKRRSTFAGDPLVWRSIFTHTRADLPYADPALTASVCDCAEPGAALRVLRSAAAHKVGVQRLTAMDTWTGDGQSYHPAARAALTATPTTVATLTTLTTLTDRASSPGIGRLGAELRLAYGDGDTLRICRSTDDGKTWSAPTLALHRPYELTAFSNIMLCAYAGAWLLFANGWTLKRQPLVVAAQDTGSGWQPLPDPPDTRGWQLAGAHFGPDHNVYLYLWGLDRTWHTLACGKLDMYMGRALGWWSSLAVVDRTGVKGEVACSNVRLGEGGGAWLLALQETAGAGYWFVASLYGLPGSTDMEEPVLLGQVDSPVATEHLTPLSRGLRAWLVGAGCLYASGLSDQDLDLPVRTLTPTRYTYTASASGGGLAELHLPRTRSAAGSGLGTHWLERAVPIIYPEVYVGDILWLDRTWTAGDQSATETLVLRAAAVTYTRAGVDVVAVDALGVLSHMRARRGKVLRAGDRTREGDVEALCHWAGVKVVGASTLPEAGALSPGFVWAANESGLGALRRYLADQAVFVRSEYANHAQDHTFVRVVPIDDGSTPVYRYVSPDGRPVGYGQHELADWALTHDGRAARLAVAMGMAMRNSPAAGEGWALAVARRLDGNRPTPVVYVDRSLANDDGSLAGRASAEAARLCAGLRFGWVESHANLGVELYDLIAVDGYTARVMGIEERWERGQLRQRLELAEAGSFAVYLG